MLSQTSSCFWCPHISRPQQLTWWLFYYYQDSWWPKLWKQDPTCMKEDFSFTLFAAVTCWSILIVIWSEKKTHDPQWWWDIWDLWINTFCICCQYFINDVDAGEMRVIPHDMTWRHFYISIQPRKPPTPLPNSLRLTYATSLNDSHGSTTDSCFQMVDFNWWHFKIWDNSFCFVQWTLHHSRGYGKESAWPQWHFMA